LAGAWAGYGFHEDGHKAGLAAASAVQAFLDDAADTQRAAAAGVRA
jgi:predicted NAD/FAD-binding protein